VRTKSLTSEQMEARVARFNKLQTYQRQNFEAHNIPPGAVEKVAARRVYPVMAPADYQGRSAGAPVKGPRGLIVIGHRRHVLFVNDSKATNADSAAQALACFSHIFWIAGGRAKTGGIASLARFFPRIRKAYLIGEAATDFALELQGRVPHVIAGGQSSLRRPTRKPPILPNPSCCCRRRVPPSTSTAISRSAGTSSASWRLFSCPIGGHHGVKKDR
jgi:hypothetical protein